MKIIILVAFLKDHIERLVKTDLAKIEPYLNHLIKAKQLQNFDAQFFKNLIF